MWKRTPAGNCGNSLKRFLRWTPDGRACGPDRSGSCQGVERVPNTVQRRVPQGHECRLQKRLDDFGRSFDAELSRVFHHRSLAGGTHIDRIEGCDGLVFAAELDVVSSEFNDLVLQGLAISPEL